MLDPYDFVVFIDTPLSQNFPTDYKVDWATGQSCKIIIPPAPP